MLSRWGKLSSGAFHRLVPLGRLYAANKRPPMVPSSFDFSGALPPISPLEMRCAANARPPMVPSSVARTASVSTRCFTTWQNSSIHHNVDDSFIPKELYYKTIAANMEYLSSFYTSHKSLEILNRISAVINNIPFILSHTSGAGPDGVALIISKKALKTRADGRGYSAGRGRGTGEDSVSEAIPADIEKKQTCLNFEFGKTLIFPDGDNAVADGAQIYIGNDHPDFQEKAIFILRDQWMLRGTDVSRRSVAVTDNLSIEICEGNRKLVYSTIKRGCNVGCVELSHKQQIFSGSDMAETMSRLLFATVLQYLPEMEIERILGNPERMAGLLNDMTRGAEARISGDIRITVKDAPPLNPGRMACYLTGVSDYSGVYYD
jgi:hypothetical protein